MLNQRKDLINIIFNEKSSFKEIKESIEKLYLDFRQKTNLTVTLEKPEPGSILQDGLALSPQIAAASILDYVRTTKFLRGIKSAIDFKLGLNQNEKIKIMYVGSGPFASLILPLIPFYHESQIEINIIDFHNDSIDALNSIISQNNFQSCFKDILAMDAMSYIKKNQFDIIIIDTIQKALFSEPQVALTNHFSNFLKADGILIPEQIKVSAVLADLHLELSHTQGKWTNFWLDIKRNSAKNNRIFLDDIFTLDKNVNKNYFQKNLEENQIVLPSIEVNKKIGKMTDLVLLTEIKIFDDIILSEEDSTGLTNLYFDHNVKSIKEDDKIKFSYQLGSNPKFAIKITQNLFS